VIELLAEDNVRTGFFERDQYEAVRTALDERPDVVVALDLAYTLGWRIRDEVLTLTWDRVDLDALTVRLDPGATKNREGREVSLRVFPALQVSLRDQRARVEALQKELGRIIPDVFPHLDGPHVGSPIRDFRRAWATACRRAGLSGKLRHDFRRTAVRTWSGPGCRGRWR
jgi:integrase